MKKMKIEFNYQTAKVALYTLLVLDIISFSNFSESKAKYYKTEPNVLSWDASLYQMYKENRIMLNKPNYETSTLQRADFTFSFPRNVIGDFSIKDEYEIIVPASPKCVIQNIQSKGTISNNKVTYTTAGTDRITVSMQCNVDLDDPNSIIKVDYSGQKYIDFDVRINERIDKEDKFLYTDAHYQQLYDIYKGNIPQYPDVEDVPAYISIQEDETNKYKTFMDWIEKYAAFKKNNHIVDYVKDHCIANDYESIKNLLLPGLRVTYDKENNAYIYTLSDNFIEYADFYSEKVDKCRIITSDDTLEMQTAFEYYLKEYYLKDKTGQEKESLFNLAVSYIKSLDERGIAYVLLPNAEGVYPTVPGLTITSETKGQRVQQLLINNPFLDTAYNKLHKIIRMSFDVAGTMRSTFSKNLPIVYDDKTISANATKTLPSYTELKNSLGTNSTSSTSSTPVPKKSFSDYFILPDDDNHHNLLINIYSNVEEDVEDQYNYAKVSILNYDNFVFNETHSKFTVYAKDRDDLVKFVEELDKIYHKTTDTDLISYGSTLFSIEYSIIKQSTPVINGGTDPGKDVDVNTNPDDSQTDIKDDHSVKPNEEDQTNVSEKDQIIDQEVEQDEKIDTDTTNVDHSGSENKTVENSDATDKQTNSSSNEKVETLKENE